MLDLILGDEGLGDDNDINLIEEAMDIEFFEELADELWETN